MSEPIASDFVPEPAAEAVTSPGTTASLPEGDGVSAYSLTTPDLMPLVDSAEARINLMISTCENALRSAMLVSSAGLECGAIWSRGWREIRAHAATGVWRTSQIALGASSDAMDRWMDLQVQALDATAARLVEAA